MRAGAFLGASLIVAAHDGRNIMQISSREQLVFPAQAILVFASRPISVTHRRSPHVRDPSFETAAKTGHLPVLLLVLGFVPVLVLLLFMVLVLLLFFLPLPVVFVSLFGVK